ncbi:hypothetical protein [Marinobacter litoralis]|nr:hypothetical protein [Marinobacter litoralis]
MSMFRQNFADLDALEIKMSDKGVGRLKACDKLPRLKANVTGEQF